jgi:hypothetical protein
VVVKPTNETVATTWNVTPTTCDETGVGWARGPFVQAGARLRRVLLELGVARTGAGDADRGGSDHVYVPSVAGPPAARR